MYGELRHGVADEARRANKKMRVEVRSSICAVGREHGAFDKVAWQLHSSFSRIKSSGMSERRDRIFLTRHIQQQPGLLAPDARERPWWVWRGGMDVPLHGGIVEVVFCILSGILPLSKSMGPRRWLSRSRGCQPVQRHRLGDEPDQGCWSASAFQIPTKYHLVGWFAIRSVMTAAGHARCHVCTRPRLKTASQPLRRARDLIGQPYQRLSGACQSPIRTLRG